ncbi:MAG: acyl carrier protein [Candidatus Omnitrophota bacterium]
MERNEIIQKTVSLVASVFKEDLRKLTLETEIGQLKHFDSLEQLNLFLKIEQEFKTNFDMQDLIRMKTVKDIVDGIAARKI